MENLKLTNLNLHLIWSAKEAFYKRHKGEIIDLKNDVSINEICHKSNSLILIYNEIQKRINFKVFQDCVLVWT